MTSIGPSSDKTGPIKTEGASASVKNESANGAELGADRVTISTSKTVAASQSHTGIKA
jgi:hypothetical protein